MKRARLGLNVGPFAHAQKTPLLRGIHIGDELRRFGVRVMQVTLTQFRDSVVSARFVRERTFNQTMLQKRATNSSRDMICRRGSFLSVLCTNTDHDGFRRESKPDLIENP